MHRTAVLLAVVLVAAPLTGCLGLGGGEGTDEPLQKERADVTAELGGVEGVITDNAVQPVVGANVTLQEIDRTTQTASDGSYAFSRLDPGTYTMVVRGDGFVSTQETVTVAAGEASIVDVILTHATSKDAFMQQQELVGFLECGAAWKEEVTGLDMGGVSYQSVAVCAIPNLVLEDLTGNGNATNDRFMHFFDLEAPIEEMIYELDWSSQNTALNSVLEIRGFTNTNGSRIMEIGGPPPLYHVVTRDHWDQVEQNFTQRCEDGDDTWCGQNFRDTGWPMQIRVFTGWNCQEIPARACHVLQEEFTHYVSAFYNEPAPDGFSVIDGNGP